MRLWCMSVLGCVLAVSPLAAQEAPPRAPGGGGEPSTACEQQVQDQYRHLSVDQLVPQVTAPQWGAQLAAIVRQLRVKSNQYELKKNQAEFAEQQWLSVLADQRMKAGGEPPAAPAN